MSNHLPELEEPHFKAALRSLALKGSPQVIHDREQVMRIIAVHEKLVHKQSAFQDQMSEVVFGVAAIILACKETAVLEAKGLTLSYSVAVARRWLTGTPYLFTPTAEHLTNLQSVLDHYDSELTLEDQGNVWRLLLNQVGLACFDKETATQFEEIVGAGTTAPTAISPMPDIPLNAIDSEPIRAFIAISMTNSEQELAPLIQLSEKVAEVFGDYGIVSYQPIIEKIPLRPRSAVAPLEIHATDERKVSNSDLVAIVTTPPSSGLGAVSELARRYGAFRVLVTSDHAVSPMLEGASPAPPQIEQGARLERDLRSYVEAHLVAIKAFHRHRIARRARAGAWWDSVIVRMERFGPGDVRLTPRHHVIGRDRFRALNAEPSLLAGMTWDEASYLEALVPGGARIEIPVDALRAAFAAEAQGWWEPTETPRVLEAGRRLVAAESIGAPKKFRRDWIKPSWWVDLYESLDR